MDRATEMREKMKHTRAFKTKGYKANIRGNCVQAPFTTLEEMFRKLPESIGFNIEMSTFQSPHMLRRSRHADYQFRIPDAVRE